LYSSFVDPAPSHTVKPEASFPCAEDFLDPALYPVDRLVPFLELAKRLLFVATPHAGGNNPGDAAFCADIIPEVDSAIGAVCKDWTCNGLVAVACISLCHLRASSGKSAPPSC
jgi:hypothetical protein